MRPADHCRPLTAGGPHQMPTHAKQIPNSAWTERDRYAWYSELNPRIRRCCSRECLLDIPHRSFAYQSRQRTTEGITARFAVA